MSAVIRFAFTVDGVPVPQGSKTGYVVGKRAVLVDANKALLKPWRAKVTAAAVAAYSYGQPRLAGPVSVWATFTFERPKTVKREWPAVRPDVDKLVRALFDGITDSQVVWVDDAQVVDLHTSKVYGPVPGVHVRVGEIQEEGMK